MNARLPRIIVSGILGGVLVTVLLKDLSLLGALLGLFAVLGIAARNAIMLIRRVQQIEHHDGAGQAEAIARGLDERFGPVLTTALATAVVVLPFAFGGGIAGFEIAHPAALVMIGGLITSTISTLAIVPALYARFGVTAASEQPAVEVAA